MMGLDPSMFGSNDDKTLVLNGNSEIVKSMEKASDEKFNLLSEQLYDMALLSHASLSPERMARFIERTNELMLKLN